MDYLSCQLWSLEHYSKLNGSTDRIFVWTEIRLIYVVIRVWHGTVFSGELWFWMSEPHCDVCVCVLLEWSLTMPILKLWMLGLIFLYFNSLMMFNRACTFRSQDLCISHQATSLWLWKETQSVHWMSLRSPCSDALLCMHVIQMFFNQICQ